MTADFTFSRLPKTLKNINSDLILWNSDLKNLEKMKNEPNRESDRPKELWLKLSS